MKSGEKLVCHVLQEGRLTEQTTEDNYHTNVAVPFIDHLLQQRLTWFEPENRVCKDIITLVPSAIIKENNLSDLASRFSFGK